MKHIEIDDDLYRYIAGQTQYIGESASQILRRLLLGEQTNQDNLDTPAPAPAQSNVSVPKAVPTAAVAQNSAEQPTLNALIKHTNPGQHTSAVKRFLLLLGILHQFHGNAFAKVLQLKGRNRVYFATDKDTLLKTGSSTNPKQIPESVYWVITNNNTSKKLTMLTQVMSLLGHNDEEISQISEILNPQGE